MDVACWAEDVELQKQLESQGDTNETAWAFFHARVGMVAEMVARAGRGSDEGALRLYWQEAFEAGNNVSGAVVQTRERHAEVAGAAAASGAYVVRSAGWDLDVRQPGEVRYNFQDSWIDFYQLRPDEGVSEGDRARVLGGEALMWGAPVNAANLEEYVWPRTLAIAEALWSDPADRTATKDMKYRFNHAVCVLNQVGVWAGPLYPCKPCPGDAGARD